MTKDEALRMALEALEWNSTDDEGSWALNLKAITAIKEALAEPEQEPVAYIHRNEYNEYRLEPHDSFDIKSIPFNVDVSLFKSPQRKPLTHEQRFDLLTKFEPHKNKWEAPAILIDMVEAAHGIKE